MKSDIEPLLEKIGQKLDWGDSASWQSEDFENLHHLILKDTGVSLSSSTLRRIWGRVDYNHAPSATTLNTLAKFAGYESWRVFLKQKADTEKTDIVVAGNINTPAASRPIPWMKIMWATGAVIGAALIFLLAFKKAPAPVKIANYSFSSKPVTRGLPNSVIFTYDATESTADSIFIQQSWDARTLAFVAREGHQHTSIYYEPGFYQAKLIAGKEVVKQHPLLIPTNGWLGIISTEPVPVYLDSSSFIYKDSIGVNIREIQKNNITMTPHPPVVKYFNVGNFNPVPVDDFSFDADIKNEYKNGAAACQLATIILVTDDGPVIIPLSAKGCISGLNLYCIDHGVQGTNADLSGFGVDFSKWAHVKCNGAGNKIQIFINEKLAYESALASKKVQLLGMSYIFQGTGAVKDIHIYRNKGSELVFHAF